MKDNKGNYKSTEGLLKLMLFKTLVAIIILALVFYLIL